MEEPNNNSAQIRKMFRDKACAHRRSERYKLALTKYSTLQEEDLEQQEVTVSQVEALAESVRKDGNTKTLNMLQKAFSQNGKNINTFLSVNGTMRSLVSLLLSKDANIAVAVCRCITNITTGNHKATLGTIKTAAPYLITFLHGSNIVLQNQSAWALGNMAADCQVCRDHLKAQGALPALMHLLNVAESHRTILESCTFALSVYTKFDTRDNRYLCEEGILKSFSTLVDDDKITESTQYNVYSILFHLTSLIDDVWTYFLESSIVEKILHRYVQLCSFASTNVLLVTPLLRCIGNLCAGPHSLIIVICSETDFLSCCIQLLKSPYLHLRKETLWLLTNIAISASSQLEDLTIILNEMEDVLCINFQNSVTMEAVNFILATKARFEENGFVGVSHELGAHVQSIRE